MSRPTNPVEMCPHGINTNEVSCVYCEVYDNDEPYHFAKDAPLHRLANHLYTLEFGLLEGALSHEKDYDTPGGLRDGDGNAVHLYDVARPYIRECLILGAISAGVPFTYNQISDEIDQINEDEHDG